MATITHNPLIKGISGKFGNDLVFRTMRGKTFVCPPARKPDKKKESVAQRGTRSTFKEAAAWAQDILQDETKKAYYRERAKALKLPNAYTAAITDYMRKPKVSTVQEHNVTTCSVHKPGFALRKVNVTVKDPDELQPVVDVHQFRNDWFIQIVKGDAHRQYTITLTITDSTDYERIEEIRI